MIYILNALPNSYLGLIAFTSEEPAKRLGKLTEEGAIALLENNEYKSAIGYSSTASLLSTRLKTEITENRITVEPDPNNDYLIAAFTPPRRLAKDEFYTEDEILAAELHYYLIY